MPEPGALRHADPRLARIIAFYEGLSPAALAGLGEVYAVQARFKDPFNDVQGLPAIGHIFDHMFRSLDAPRFVVLTAVAAGDDAFLTWDFRFSRRGSWPSFTGARPMCIHGASHLRLDPDGRVALHRDYWDAAEELYEKLPLVGGLMRWLKRRAGG